ncbi:MAG: 4Fe-4S binding protein [Oscillospiraceae bacterium]|jgi:iron only hydrogenase large subunit-like protein|nr:4Fe-4S binding protein [Oscillospiraceae bacterium]
MNHCVTLDKEKCKGCTTCIRQCPTEAIRVRRGKAKIISERCIDCGRCVLACPYHAKRAVCDPLSMMERFAYTVALPAPSLYGQFRNLDDIGIVLGGLLEMGFNGVYEVARAAEEMSAHALVKHGIARKGTGYGERTFPANSEIFPLISTACPACVRLICQRFPRLIPHLAPEIAPVELAALAARAEASRKTGLPPGRIGVFFITPCPAKMTAAHFPLGLSEPVLDGAFSMAEIYVKLLPAMKRAAQNGAAFQTAGLTGVGWAVSSGESAALKSMKTIAADEIPNVIAVLEAIEDGKLPEVGFVELNACTQGCVGGCLTVENPYVSKMRIRELMKKLPDTLLSRLRYEEPGTPPTRDLPLEYEPADVLDSDMSAAIEKRRRMEALLDRLPGLDCASCGAPSCHALAEDVVRGYAQEADCVFLTRESMDEGGYLPPPFRPSVSKC